jgi:hypothetical protein
MTLSTKKRQPCSSIAGQINTFQNAQKSHNAPKMERSAKKFFDAMVISKAHDEWSPAQLSLAAEAAADMALLERMRKQVLQDGDLTTGKGGEMIMHPGHKIIDAAVKRVAMNMRMLQLGAVKEARDLMPGRRAENAAREILNHGDEESLLA